jgi:hypothetical protein
VSSAVYCPGEVEGENVAEEVHREDGYQKGFAEIVVGYYRRYDETQDQFEPEEMSVEQGKLYCNLYNDVQYCTSKWLFPKYARHVLYKLPRT